jgi:hypothetical protein
MTPHYFLNAFMRECHQYSRLIFCFGLAAAWACIPSQPAIAQVSIIPLVQEISVNRGGATSFQLQIHNRGSEVLSFSMHTFNLSISEEGLPAAIPESTAWSCKDWITFKPEVFELEPDKVQIVDGVIQAPTDAQGGYYAFITCEFNPSSEPLSFGKDNKSKAEIQFGRAVSSILLVTAQSSRNHVQLEPESLFVDSGREIADKKVLTPEGQSTGKVWQVNLKVKNTGNVHTIATGELGIWTENARLFEKAQLSAGKGYMFPGRRRIFKAQGTKPLADGIYMIKAQIRDRDGKMVQGAFPYSVVNGVTSPGAASEKIRGLIEASAPSFSLSNNLLDFGIAPGGKSMKGVRLTNYTRDTLSVSARLVNWTLNDSGSVILNPDSSKVIKPCLSWIEMSPVPISLPPNGSGNVEIKVTAPEELNGEYYAAIVFETPQTAKNLPTELEMPRTVFVTASFKKNLDYNASIKSIEYAPISSMMRSFAVSVSNDGNAHCFADGRLEIYDKKYNLIGEPITFGGPQDNILPERVRGYIVPVPGALEPGIYEAVFKVKYAEGRPEAIMKYNFESRKK